MSNMIITSECETCEYGSVNDTDKARVKVTCSLKGKTYYYGICIPCDCHKRRRKED